MRRSETKTSTRSDGARIPMLWDVIDRASDGAPFPVATAKADPGTSAAAEAQHTASGKRARHVEILSKLVAAYPDETACELARRLSWQPGNTIDRHEASRRLADARTMQLVHNGPARECTVQHTQQSTWRPGPKPTEGDHG